MSQSQLNPNSPQITERPCAACGTAMVLAYIRPKAIGVDQHTFECVKCGYCEKTLIQISRRRWQPLRILQWEASSHEAGPKR
jgi:hypothetical protein